MPKADNNFRFNPVRLHAMRVQIGALTGDALQKMLENLADFFKGEKIILDFCNEPIVDFSAIHQMFSSIGVAVLGVSGVLDYDQKIVEAANLPIFADDDFVRAEKNRPPAPVLDEVKKETPPEPAPVPESSNNLVGYDADSNEHNALIVEAPVRSGMEYYGTGDVVVLGRVHAGAQIFAEGNIFVCGVLKGKAMAGGAENKKARIFTADMQAELVSIAGVFQKFENGVDEKLRGKPVCISLETDGQLEWLKIELL